MAFFRRNVLHMLKLWWACRKCIRSLCSKYLQSDTMLSAHSLLGTNSVGCSEVSNLLACSLDILLQYCLMRFALADLWMNPTIANSRRLQKTKATQTKNHRSIAWKSFRTTFLQGRKQKDILSPDCLEKWFRIQSRNVRKSNLHVLFFFLADRKTKGDKKLAFLHTIKKDG